MVEAVQTAQDQAISRNERILREMEALVDDLRAHQPPYDCHGYARNWSIATTHLEDALLRFRYALEHRGAARIDARDHERG